VNEIVRRLEGWPLAIELAAARVRVLLPPVLASRLESGITDLGSGPVDLPQRHRTIEETIVWSYELLDPLARVMLGRMGVFAGGFTLDAAEAVGAGSPVTEPLEALANLLDASLLRRRVDHGSAYFSLLAPVREFALERLRASGEEPEVLGRHAQHFLQLAEAHEPKLSRADQVASMDQLMADQENLRAALRFGLTAGLPDLGLRMGGALWRFWHASGQLAEGRKWLEDLLALPGASDASSAKGLSGLAGLAYWQGDYATARRSYEEAVQIYRRLGDRLATAHALFGLSTTLIWLGEHDGGTKLVGQARQIYEELGEKSEVRNILMASGFARWRQGDLAGARGLWEESMEIAREVGDDAEAAINQLALASLSSLEGNDAEAMAEAGRGLEELVALKNSAGTVMALDWIAALACSRMPRDACRLAGAAEKLRARQGGGVRPESVGLVPARVGATPVIGEQEAAAAFEDGSALDLDGAVTLALTMLEEARRANEERFVP
jgi:tetratricopeptide (TPR) repeat protein